MNINPESVVACFLRKRTVSLAAVRDEKRRTKRFKKSQDETSPFGKLNKIIIL